MDIDSAYNVQAQLERTVLSWTRSCLALGANGGLLARAGFAGGRTAFAVAGIAVIGSAAVFWVVAGQRYRRARKRPAGDLAARRRRPCVALAALSAFVSCADVALVASR